MSKTITIFEFEGLLEYTVSQKRHRLVASCQFHRLISINLSTIKLQQVC